jgi:hypothetical protein
MTCIRCLKSGKPCIDATGHPGKKQRQLNRRILEIESRIESILSSSELQVCTGDNALSIGNALAFNPVDSPSELSYKAQTHDQGLPMDSFVPCNG